MSATATSGDPVLHWEGYAHEAEAKYGIPAAVLLGLIKVESGGNEGEVSAAGAAGLTQFMPGTAQSYGVNTSPGHARSQIMGAARYLKDLGFAKDPQRALAAYNAGPGGAGLAVAQQYAKDVLAASHNYGSTSSSSTPGPSSSSSSSSSGEWGGGILAPLLQQLAKGYIYMALIMGGAVLVFVGVRRSITDRPEAT